MTPERQPLSDQREREVIDLIKTGAEFFYIGAPGDLERLSHTAISELRAENADLKAWAIVGQGGHCIHSKTTDDCAGCLVRVTLAERDRLRAWLKLIIDVREDYAGEYAARALDGEPALVRSTFARPSDEQEQSG